MKQTIDESKLLYVTNSKEWRDWLQKHYQSEKEIWLVYYKKHSGKPRISYNDAVEEALCFGWIDSNVKSIDEERSAQKFSVRNPKSSYSQANKERLKELVRQGKVIEEVEASLGDILKEEFAIPPDILSAIQSNPEAWENFQKLSPSYIRIRIAFIEGARNRPQMFQTRLNYFIKMTAKNKQFGFGGIQKYY
jgi:uncharacterized protein YdeI (YjbR/CyaY-like superfamily)